MKKVFAFVLTMLLVFTLCCQALADLTIYFLDVGQADAIYLECDGHSMMIDGGGEDVQSDKEPETDSWLIYHFLTENVQVTQLDCVVATHPHKDHIAGLSSAFDACSVAKLYTPVMEDDRQCFQKLLAKAEENGTKVIIPAEEESFSLGGAEVRFLPHSYNADDANTMSLIVKVTYGKTSFLFMGDAVFAVEDELLSSGVDLSADVLKVGHHGSDTSTSQDFLSEVLPKYAVISTEWDSSYQHPRQETLDMLAYYDVYVYRTDLDGTIKCTSNGTELSFLTEYEVVDEWQRYIGKDNVENANDEGTDTAASDIPAVVVEEGSEVNENTEGNDTGVNEPTTPPPFDENYAGGYVCNKKKGVIHYADCPAVVNQMSEKNKVYFATYQEVLEAGYTNYHDNCSHYKKEEQN